MEPHNTHQVAEQVGIFGAIATFLLGLFGIHRSEKNRVHAKLEELAEKKADRADVDRHFEELRADIREVGTQNAADHRAIFDHLLGRKEL